jgi:hypothetical protein
MPYALQSYTFLTKNGRRGRKNTFSAPVLLKSGGKLRERCIFCQLECFIWARSRTFVGTFAK